jgi:predicted  nucleic acid-binding Zn-ribbon protein
MDTERWQELIQIQEEEDRISALKREYDRLQESIFSDLNLERVKELESNREETKQYLNSLSKQLKKNEDELGELSRQQGEISEKLYGGTIQNSKELSQLEQKLAELKSKQNLIEETVLNLMQQQETLTEKEGKLKQELELDQAQLTERKIQFEQEESVLKREMKAHLIRRKKLLSSISPELYDWYGRIRKDKGGKAVVPVINGNCGGCYVALPGYFVSRVRSGKQLLTCENCGRILYWKA